MREKVVAYVRVSTLDQVREGISLDAQIARIKAYCELNDFDLADIFVEEGVSGGKALSERPKGKLMLERLKHGDITGVVGWDISRVWRSTLDCLKCIEDWQKQGISLHLVSMQIRTDSAMGKMFITIIASVATCEREQISERTKLAMNHLKTTGKVYSSIPMGFDRVGNTLEVNEQEMELVREIFKMSKAGMSLNGIAKMLNEQDIPSKNGSKFYHTTIRSILRNDLYKDHIEVDTMGVD